jgi:DNA-binding NtrC family response regulator
VMSEDHIVFIVDDDARIREARSKSLESPGIRAITQGSVWRIWAGRKLDLPRASSSTWSCRTDTNGLALQGQIADGDHPPIIFTAAQAAGKNGGKVRSRQSRGGACAFAASDIASRRVSSGGDEIPERSRNNADRPLI